MYFRSTLRKAALICAVIVAAAAGSWRVDAATTGVAVAPDKSDSTTEEIQPVTTKAWRIVSAVVSSRAGIDHVEPVAVAVGDSAASSAVADDLGPDNTQVKH